MGHFIAHVQLVELTGALGYVVIKWDFYAVQTWGNLNFSIIYCLEIAHANLFSQFWLEPFEEAHVLDRSDRGDTWLDHSKWN